jgi:hypothetical protein
MDKVAGGERPGTPPDLEPSPVVGWIALRDMCWKQNPASRPGFEEICEILVQFDTMYIADNEEPTPRSPVTSGTKTSLRQVRQRSSTNAGHARRRSLPEEEEGGLDRPYFRASWSPTMEPSDIASRGRGDRQHDRRRTDRPTTQQQPHGERSECLSDWLALSNPTGVEMLGGGTALREPLLK